jgi:hypothetical protein
VESRSKRTDTVEASATLDVEAGPASAEVSGESPCADGSMEVVVTVKNVDDEDAD